MIRPGIHLKLRRIGIDTFKENVAYLHRDCPVYHTEGFQALAKVEINSVSDHQQVLAVLNVVNDEKIMAIDELGLSEQAFIQLGLYEGDMVCIAQAVPPESLDAVHRKIAGERLNESDFLSIIRDVVANRYSRMEMSAFLVACSESGMEREELLYLTEAMVKTGEKLDWGEPLVVDKHCIGGIPGNRTTMLVVPIIAAHGMLIPKTSSRAITSPSGTADTMETLARVDLDLNNLREIVRHERGCLAWGGRARLAPADDILISVERPLSLDSPGQMVSSILSKKVAAGATHLLIDIPVGPTAKVHRMNDALRLRKLFEYVGDRLGLHLEVVITNGEQPIGRGIGPALEARDVIKVLENDPEAPSDLREKALRLAGRILEFDPDVRGGHGYAIARDILETGRAMAKMQAIIAAQGENKDPPKLGELIMEVTAPESGFVTEIDNLQMARIARLAGAPMDKGAGVDLLKKLGDRVEEGESLYRIHAEFPSDFDFAQEQTRKDIGFRIGDKPAAPNYFPPL
ncbi:thymidine phosphorylase [Mariprofundus ferrinatatus]|uniref:Putative thymidine phosphorylase n=1 Tax=Mariprofundus ferrinatatus TaxID=1921087 RepID=A0A2K8L321_9PROT|nr:thymidine phosphorylase family protein [Mariprofundus ferrinatatus]ATX81677.1 thymidine phosphorylase [Mariprofundus ferrinatatus]